MFACMLVHLSGNTFVYQGFPTRMVESISKKIYSQDTPF